MGAASGREINVMDGARVACVPFNLVLLKDLALGVVANGSGLDEAAQIELFCPKHRHGGRQQLMSITT